MDVIVCFIVFMSRGRGSRLGNISTPIIRQMCRFCAVEDKNALRRLIEQTADGAALNRLF